ncbi:MAG: HmuY family protein [Flavobacteriaceae bacterium]|nr:HmuY family protein [Flavobacteriaceae bacterium]
MKTIKLLSLIALFIGFTSCDSDDDPVTGGDILSFEGTFSREFSVGNSPQRATYTIAQDKISYALDGGFASTTYDIKKEYFSKSDNRWVGFRESNDTYYVLFFKDISETEFSLYKKKVASLEAGKTEPVPAADNTENYGWNVYKKDLASSGKMSNLHAPQVGGHGAPISGEFTKFSFATGEITDSDTEWDIAFRATTVIINGGSSAGTTDEPDRNGDGAAYIASGTMDQITSVDTSKFAQDSESGLAIPTGSGNGWYNYTGSPDHKILPIAGKILVIKTHDGKYAKVEILSYYKDADTANDSKYYTFNYAYQSKEGITSF